MKSHCTPLLHPSKCSFLLPPPLPTSPRTSSSDFPSLHASSFRRIIRRALVTALLEIRPRRAHSFGPEKEEGAQISNARSIILERMDGRARGEGGRDHLLWRAHAGDDVHSAFCKEQRSRRDTSSSLLSPPLTDSLPRPPERRLASPAAPVDACLEFGQKERESERASASVGTWNIAPFLASYPALPLPRQSVSRAEQLHLAKLHETMNRREVYYRDRWASKRRGSPFNGWRQIHSSMAVKAGLEGP